MRGFFHVINTTQLKYDIVASKFMAGIENHQRRNAPAPSPIASFGLIGVVLQGMVALLVLLGEVVHWLGKKLNLWKNKNKIP